MLVSGGRVPASLKYGSEYFLRRIPRGTVNYRPLDVFSSAGTTSPLTPRYSDRTFLFSPMLTGGQPLHLRLDGDDIFITQREN